MRRPCSVMVWLVCSMRWRRSRSCWLRLRVLMPAAPSLLRRPWSCTCCSWCCRLRAVASRMAPLRSRVICRVGTPVAARSLPRAFTRSRAACRAVSVCSLAARRVRQLLTSRCCACRVLSWSRESLRARPRPTLPWVMARIGRVARSMAWRITSIFKSLAMLQLPACSGPLAPFDQIRKGQRVHVRRRPVKDHGQVGHGVFYATRAASFADFCSKKPDTATPQAIRSAGSMAPIS